MNSGRCGAADYLQLLHAEHGCVACGEVLTALTPMGGR